MGIRRIIAERDFRAIVARWGEQDIISLSQRLYDPDAYSGGILKITKREYRALPELNRRVTATTPNAMLYPFNAWVEGRGLHHARRAA
jgi:hypothetical protein